jgi:glycosyltransferase involved in cell wall biosynthesis
VSVIIPVRNEAKTIAAAIGSALDQDYAGNLEVVVADGMSDDGTRDVLEQISTANRTVRWVDNPTGRTPSGLNIAIESSHGDIIVRCDAHAELPSDYVKTAVATLQATGAVNVGGIQDAVGIKPMQRAIAYAMSSRIGVGDARFHYGGDSGETDTVYLGVFRRNALIEAGMFDEKLDRNQDYELNIRLRANEGKVWFEPRLRVLYRPRSSLQALWRQYFEYGKWKRRVVRMHPEATRLRQLVPPLFVVGLAVSGVLAFTPLRVTAVVVPGAYVALISGATLVQLSTTRDPAAFLFPAAVATMHISWGLGFLSSIESEAASD